MAIFTTTDGCRLYFETHGFEGDKPAVVFLNGTTQTALQWRPQARFFKNDFKVVCYDGRAQGKSDLGRRPLSLDLHVEDLLSLLAFLQVPKAHLVGLSHGAQVALACAARHPQKSGQLVLCSIGAEASARARSMVGSWIEILDRGGMPALAWAALPVVLGETYLRNNRTILPKMVDAVVARNRQESLRAHLAALLSYRPPAADAKKVSGPCLVAFGSEDPLLPAAGARALAGMTSSRVKEFRQTGHSVPLETPDLFNNSCRRFLTQRRQP